MYRISKTVSNDIKKLDLPKDQKFAAEIFPDILLAPINTMCDNAGYEFEKIDSDLETKEEDVGFNFLTGKFVNMYEDGVIDPAKVTKNALRNAVSAAGTLLTTNYAIIEE